MEDFEMAGMEKGNALTIIGKELGFKNSAEIVN